MIKRGECEVHKASSALGVASTGVSSWDSVRVSFLTGLDEKGIPRVTVVELPRGEARRLRAQLNRVLG